MKIGRQKNQYYNQKTYAKIYGNLKVPFIFEGKKAV